MSRAAFPLGNVSPSLEGRPFDVGAAAPAFCFPGTPCHTLTDGCSRPEARLLAAITAHALRVFFSPPPPKSRTDASDFKIEEREDEM